MHPSIRTFHTIQAPIEQQNDVMAMIGGAPTVTASTALHAVALLAVSDPAFPTRGHFGGGCIVSRNRVVTAAHVVANAESVTAWFFDGAVDLASRMSTNSIWIQIMMGFDAETRENDVAIVMFPANVFSLANVIPVTSLAAPTGGAASLAGFGFTTPDATEPNELPLLADHTVQACASDLEAQSTHFCALAAAATFVCPGDNGNGLWTEEGTVKSLVSVDIQ